MGPRSFNRGNLRTSRTIGDAASMGPRSFNRGNPAALDCGLLRQLDFNGAAVIQPRKQQFGDCYCGVSWGPSMGPRSFNRGNRTTTSETHALKTFNGAAVIQPRKRGQPLHGRDGPILQWGRGHSTAETAEHLGIAMHRFALQWGRGHSTAETCTKTGSHAGSHGPSMGPRSFNRGNKRSAIRHVYG